MNRRTVQDPVCGMRFAPDRAEAVLEWRGRTVHFCCESCLRSFRDDPKRYVQPDEEAGR